MQDIKIHSVFELYNRKKERLPEDTTGSEQGFQKSFLTHLEAFTSEQEFFSKKTEFFIQQVLKQEPLSRHDIQVGLTQLCDQATKLYHMFLQESNETIQLKLMQVHEVLKRLITSYAVKKAIDASLNLWCIYIPKSKVQQDLTTVWYLIAKEKCFHLLQANKSGLTKTQKIIETVLIKKYLFKTIKNLKKTELLHLVLVILKN